MLKGEVVTQFVAHHFGSTASSVSSAAAGWYRPVSSALYSTREPAPQPAAPSHLSVPKSSDMQFMGGRGAFQPVIDLNRTPVAGDTSSGHSKAPRVRATEDLPDAAVLFGQMPTQPKGDEVLHGLLPWPISVVVRGTIPICQYAGRHSGWR
jgi:hypothetical protein